MPRIKYIENENNDRDFPDAFVITEAELKINGEYICVDPCGSGSAEHSLGDINIYIDINGDDSYAAEGELSRIGTIDDPFKTIERAFEYVNAIVTIEGDIYLHLSKGTFYIADTIRINHPNKIIIIGSDIYFIPRIIDVYFTDSIHFGDDCLCENIYYYFGSNGVFTGNGDNIDNYMIIMQSVNINILADSIYFADLYAGSERHASISNGNIGLNTYGGRKNVPSCIDKFIFAINTNATFWANDYNHGTHIAVSDGIIGLFGSGGTVDGSKLSKLVFNIEGIISYYIDVTHNILSPGGVSNGTTGLCVGGSAAGTAYTYIDYFLFCDDTSMHDFGDLSEGRSAMGCCFDRTYGYFAGGKIHSFLNTKLIDYVNISVQSTATFFGNLSVGKNSTASCSNDTRGLIAGGQLDTSISVIEYITFSSHENSSNFGNLLHNTWRFSACSGN